MKPTKLTIVAAIAGMMSMSTTSVIADGVVEAKSPSKDREVTVIGQPETQPVYESVKAYKLDNWEDEINSLIDDVNAISPKVADLIEKKDLLVSKPDGNPLKNLVSVLKNVSKAVETAVAEAGEQDPVAMEKLRDVQSKIDKRLQRLEDYTFGPKVNEFLLQLTGEGKGVFDVELNNGQTVEVRYAVGADRSITPDVVDYPVVAVMAIAANSNNETSRYAYGHGVTVRGENTVIIQWDDLPHDYQGAKWKAQTVHNISAKAWKFMTCKTGYCSPLSNNAHIK